MVDRPRATNTFRDAADRQRYEREQMMRVLTQEQWQHVRRQEEENAKAAERKQEELRQRAHEEIEKQKDFIERERPQIILTPDGSKKRRLSDQEIQNLAERRVRDNHKAELDTFKKELDRNIFLQIAVFASEKQQELGKEREVTRELAEQKRQDRQTTAVGREPREDRSNEERAKEEQERRDNRNKRVNDRLRKARQLQDRQKNKDDHERE